MAKAMMGYHTTVVIIKLWCLLNFVYFISVFVLMNTWIEDMHRASHVTAKGYITSQR